MTCTQSAYTDALTLEKGRIYEFQIPGVCVKAGQSDRHGVGSGIQLFCKYALQFKLAKEGWATAINYEPIPFVDLAQKTDADWFDIVGVVEEIRPVDTKEIQAKSASGQATTQKEKESAQAYSLRSRAVILSSGAFFC